MDTEKEQSLEKEIERLNWEFSLLYEISNAIRTTLRLDQILYIILTALTSHEGLGFNRAMLFLVNEKEHVLEGVKVFDRVFVLPVPVSELDKIESAFIRELKPEYNGNGKK